MRYLGCRHGIRWKRVNRWKRARSPPELPPGESGVTETGSAEAGSGGAGYRDGDTGREPSDSGRGESIRGNGETWFSSRNHPTRQPRSLEWRHAPVQKPGTLELPPPGVQPNWMMESVEPQRDLGGDPAESIHAEYVDGSHTPRIPRSPGHPDSRPSPGTAQQRRRPGREWYVPWDACDVSCGENRSPHHWGERSAENPGQVEPGTMSYPDLEPTTGTQALAGDRGCSCGRQSEAIPSGTPGSGAPKQVASH